MAKVYQYDHDIADGCLLFYSTIDCKSLNFHKDAFDADVVSHTYECGYGTIQFDKPITSIGHYAFKDCDSLTRVTIPDSVIKIGVGAFEGCISLTKISIPDSVAEIGKNAFGGCESLTSVTIGSGITSIGESAFMDCSIESVHISDLSAWCKIDFYDMCSNPLGGNLYLDGVLVEELTTITEDVKRYTFSNCRSLKSLTIPHYNLVGSIGYCAFHGCKSLTNVDLTKSCITHIGWSAFEYCESLTSLMLPDCVTEIGQAAFYCCKSLTNITIPNSVSKIGSLSFGYCTSLRNITIPNSVYSIGSAAFFRCTSLTSVVIPVQQIEKRAFEDCTSLRDVIIGDSVKTIGEEAFSGCDSINIITIPASVYSIGDEAFSNCSCLRKVYCKGVIPPSASNHIRHAIGMFDSDPLYLKIYVPRNAVDAYKESHNWKKYSSFIVGE